MQLFKSPHSDVPFYQFPHLSGNGLVNGVFSRHGGRSEKPFDSLNVSYHVGDETNTVKKNRALIKKTLGVQTLVSARQVHGDKVYQIKEKPLIDEEVEGVDALITDCNVSMMIQQADCQAVMLYDQVRRAIGICHAGWRGSVANIIAKTVSAMVEAFGTEPEDLQAAISPSLGPCCAEFVNYETELPKPFHQYQISAPEKKFDFIAISRDQLIDSGVGRKNIFHSGVCTCCNTDYFSFRRTKTTGRFCTIIGLC